MTSIARLGLLAALATLAVACSSDTSRPPAPPSTTSPDMPGDGTPSPVDGGSDADLCNNGSVDPGERCDGESCPTDCDDNDACTMDVLEGSAASCSAVCVYSSVQACQSGDGCCPQGCVFDQDDDCPRVCGNGRLDDGELCDSACPTDVARDCLHTDACAEVTITGSAAMCDAMCSATMKPGCAPLVRLSLGVDHSCGVEAGGRLLCWGNNDNGQLGDGTTMSSPSLKAIAAPEGVTGWSLLGSAWGHRCAADTLGRGWCWGQNDQGQLGTGDTAAQAGIVAMASTQTWSTFALGRDHSCALDTMGAPWCWGSNARGQLGVNDDGISSALTPTAVISPDAQPVSFLSIDAGSAHSCGLDMSGQVRCWGADDRGQSGGDLSDGSQLITVRTTTGQILSDIVSIACGDTHSCAVDLSGQVWCWGDNARGQLGRVTAQPLDARADLVVGPAGFGDLTRLALGAGHSCALDLDGQLWCWGDNALGQLGAPMPASSSSPLALIYPFGVERFDAVDAGADFTCGLARDGSAWCWGDNARGQLGAGDVMARTAPTIVAR